MRIIGNKRSDQHVNHCDDGHELDLRAIRCRVQKIKAGWSTKERLERAAEGRRRRAELEGLLRGENAPKLAVYSPSQDMSLVG